MHQNMKRTAFVPNFKTLAASSFLTRTAFASMAFLAAFPHDASALPTGADVESGNVNITQPTSRDLVVNQGSDRAIINWQNFDIMQGESTRFVQPNVNSVALNRVVAGQSASQILGTLTANGKIILVNPNGVFFGTGSKVDVAGLVASSANISSANFLAGKMNFDQAGRDGASIINKGAITAKDGGLVALVAPGVENNGTITANAGTIALASGKTVAVDMYGDNLYSFAVGRADQAGVNEKGESMKDGAANSGVLTATGGTVRLSANVAKNIVTNAVNNTGVIEASAAHVVGGAVVLDGGAEGNVNVAGSIDASGKGAGQKGGSVTVTGEHIKLASAKIDASGSAAGGKVRIGDDYQGGGKLAHAKTVSVDKTSLVNVSAIDQGNAGSAVIWSDENTAFSGTLLGGAGAAGGNGGNAEISSTGDLSFLGMADLHGVHGKNGSLLLDPANIVIDVPMAASISSTLQTSTDVDIETSALPGSDAGDITLNSLIAWTANSALKLGANHDITINGGILSTTDGLGANGTLGNYGSVTLAAGNNVALNNGILTTHAGNIAITGKAISFVDSLVSALGGNIDILGSGAFNNTLIGSVSNDSTKTGHIAINQSTGGSIQNAIDAIGTYGSGGAKVTLGSGNFTQQATISGKNNFTLTGQGAGSTTISSPDSLTTLFDNGSPVKAVVGVENGDNVTLSNFTVDGLNKGDANYRFTGIAYDNAGGRITGTTVTNIEGNPANGVQGGNGIYAYVDAGNHALEIDHNTVNRFQKTGIVLNGSGLPGSSFSGNVHDNTVTGLGAVDFIAQNGVQFGFGTTGTIANNTIRGIGYTPDSYEAIGILLYQAGDGVEVSTNTIDGAGYAAGIYATGSNGANIHDNSVKNAQDGIGADSSDDVSIHNNSIGNVTNTGILFDTISGTSSITDNLINTTGGNAIDVHHADEVDISGNYIGFGQKAGAWGAAGNIKGDGIFVDQSNGATIHNNNIAQTFSTVGDSGSGIHVTGSDGVTIGGATLADGNKLNNIAWDGIKLGNDTNVTVSNNKIEHIGRAGIYLGAVTGAQVTQNRLTSALDNLTGSGSIASDFGGNLTISGNSIFAGTNGSGIYMNAATGTNVIDSNRINTVVDHGILVTGGAAVSATNNAIMHALKDGIHFDTVSDAVIDGNTVHVIGGDGIHATNLTLTNAAKTDISGNTVYDITGKGIYLNGATNAYITNNLVRNAVDTAIEALNLSATPGTASSGGGITFLALLPFPTPATPPGQNVVAGNVVDNGQADGIHVDTATNVIIVENLVHDVKHFGIELANAVVNGVNSTVVAANDIYNLGFNGIDLKGIDNAYVVENNIHDIGPSHALFERGAAPDPALDYGDGIHAVNLRSVNVSGNSFLPTTFPPIFTEALVVTPSVGASNYGRHESPGDYSAEFSGNAGQATIENNFVHIVDHDGIHVDTAVNAIIDNNTVSIAGHDGIFATSLTVNSSAGVSEGTFPVFPPFFFGTTSGNTDVSYNDVSYALSRDGIHLDGVTNANVTYNTVHNTAQNGIFGANFAVTTDTVPTFTGGFPFGFSLENVSAETSVSNNTVYNNTHDGIHLENIANANINDNVAHDLNHDGIFASNLFRTGSVSTSGDGSTNAGSSELNRNETYYLGNDGIHLDTVENLNATFNNVHDLSHDGIFGSNLYTLSGSGLNYRSTIDHTTAAGIGHDGIHVESIQNASVTSSKIDRVTANGVYAANPLTDNTRPGGNSGFGNGFFDNSYFGSNVINSAGADGIHLEGMDRAEAGFNSIHFVAGAGVHFINSLDTFSHVNTLTNSAFGFNLESSNVADLTTNTLRDNGIGIQLSASNDGLLQHNIFTGNTLGINLDNAQSTFLVDESLSIPTQGVGLRVANGSANTRVFGTSFDGGNVAVEVTDPGSDMQFGDNGSNFTGNNYYFVLQNGAMFGDTLDASQQTFDGFRGAAFTQDQLSNAEVNHTIDVADNATLGDVFYTDFIPSASTTTGATGFDTTLLDDFLNNRRNAYRRGNFSFAGRALNLVVDPIDPGSFDPATTSLSLLNRASPTAAADVANLFANLAPAAGGNQNPGKLSAQQLANLAPAAGGATAGCANNFLGDGFATGFSCNVQ